MAKRSDIILGLGIFLGVLSACLLVAFGLRYVKPYIRVKSMEAGKCTVLTGDILTEQMVTCRCGRDSGSQCRSQCPCLRLYVNFTSEKGHKVLDNVTLYDSYETLLLQRNKLQCSYHKCDRVQPRNVEAVVDFAEKYAHVGESYRCYYEPSDPKYAILNIVTKDMVIHTMLWPSIGMVGGLGVVIAYVFFTSPANKKTNYATSSLERIRPRQENRYERVHSEELLASPAV